MNTKHCYGCKKTIDVKLFSPSSCSSDGLMSKCETCREKANISHYKSSLTPKKNYCIVCAENRKYKRASYGLLKDMKKTHCTVHKTAEMIDLAHLNNGCIVCKENGKFKNACYGLFKDKKKTHCSQHKTDDMINLADRNRGCIICSENGKFKQASFGLLSNKKKTHCAQHKTDDMINLADRNRGCIVCSENGKFKIASYGLLSDKKKTHCTEHKTEEMIDLKDINKGCVVCKENGKFKRATYGLLSNKKKTHCAKHKTDDMIDLVDRDRGCIVCKENGKFKIATFGLLSNKNKTHCTQHKTDNMINLADINRGCVVCKENGKFKVACYGLLSTMKKTHCTEHKTDDMIDLQNRKKGCIVCKENGKFKIASFGLLKDKKMTHCTEHKTNEMVDLVNLNNGCIVCKENGKFKQASFGKLFEKKLHCKVHAQSNEYSKNNPKCEKCFEQPLYGDEKLSLIPERCEKHKKPTDVDMVSKICCGCWVNCFIPSTQTKCSECLGWTIRKEYNRGIKEGKVADCLTQLSKIMGSPAPVRDRRIAQGCSSKRPDFYYPDFTNTFSLIVEVDETQHSKYSCGIQGEIIRMINLFEEDSGGFPLIFIRFNPDPYYYKGKEVNAYRGREAKLQEVIKGLKNRTEMDCYIGVIYLFYDEFEEVKIEPLTYEMKDGELHVGHMHPLDKEINRAYKL